MDKEQYGGWCRLALKRFVTGSVLHVQWWVEFGEGLVQDGQNQV